MKPHPQETPAEQAFGIEAAIASWPRQGKRLNLSLLGAICLYCFTSIISTTAQAQTLYWQPSSGVWSSTTGPTPWSTTSGGTANTSWTNGNSAVIEASNPNIDVLGASGAEVIVNNLTINSGMTVTGGGSTARILRVTGSGTGDLTWNTTVSGLPSLSQLRLVGSTAWNGTLTVTGAGSANNIRINAGATGTSTKLVVNGGQIRLIETPAATPAYTHTIGELSGTGGQITLNGATAGTTILNVSQTSHTTFSGTMINNGSAILQLNKGDSGRLRLNGNNTYTGATNVNTGTLLINGTTSGQGTYTVASAAALGGNGTIGFSGSNRVTVNSGGNLNPGDITDAGVASVGTLTIGGATSGVGLAFLGNATIDFTLGSSKDMISLSGATMIGSAAGGANSILFNFSNFGDASVGQTYDLISFGGTTQGIVLSSFGISSISSTAGWDGTFQYGGDGNTLQFAITAIPSTIPEPSTFGLLMAGIMAFAVVGLRRTDHRSKGHLEVI